MRKKRKKQANRSNQNGFLLALSLLHPPFLLEEVTKGGGGVEIMTQVVSVRPQSGTHAAVAPTCCSSQKKKNAFRWLTQADLCPLTELWRVSTPTSGAVTLTNWQRSNILVELWWAGCLDLNMAFFVSARSSQLKPTVVWPVPSTAALGLWSVAFTQLLSLRLRCRHKMMQIKLAKRDIKTANQTHHQHPDFCTWWLKPLCNDETKSYTAFKPATVCFQEV